MAIFEGKCFEEKLVIEVQKYPWLYDTKLEDYRDMMKKSSAFTEIAKAVGEPVEKCISKWAYLRDKFGKELRASMRMKSGQSGKQKRKWVFLDMLSFLEPHIAHRGTWTSTLYQEAGAARSPDNDTSGTQEDHSELSQPWLYPVGACKVQAASDGEIDDGPTSCDSLDQNTNLPADFSQSNGFTRSQADIASTGQSPPHSASSGGQVTPHYAKKRSRETAVDVDKLLVGALASAAQRICQTGSGPSYDEFQHYGLSVAARLRQMPAQRNAYARMKIEEILFDAEFGVVL